MTTDKKYTPWWIAWLAMFGIIEAIALLDKDKGDTFTEHWRKWMALQSKTKIAGRLITASILLWLAWHFLR